MRLEKSHNGWELLTIADGSLSCENYDLLPEHIDRIEKMLRPEFGRSMKKNRIMVDYDNWSGVFIMQMPGIHTKSSDRVIKKIYVYLSASELKL